MAQLLDVATGVFGPDAKNEPVPPPVDVKTQYTQIGELTRTHDRCRHAHECFVSLAAMVDWFSRPVLSWRVPITLEAAICVEPLEEALAREGSRTSLP